MHKALLLQFAFSLRPGLAYRSWSKNFFFPCCTYKQWKKYHVPLSFFSRKTRWKTVFSHHCFLIFFIQEKELFQHIAISLASPLHTVAIQNCRDVRGTKMLRFWLYECITEEREKKYCDDDDDVLKEIQHENAAGGCFYISHVFSFGFFYHFFRYRDSLRLWMFN